MPTTEQMYDQAIELQQRGKMQEAVGKLQEVLQQDPEYALAHAALGVFLGKMDRHDEALEHAGKVCQLEPDDPFSFVAMSLICQKAGRLPEAEQALMQARQAELAARQSQNE